MYLGKKSPKFFPEGPFFFVLQLNVYRSALILRNFPCPEKFLVMRLQVSNSKLNWRDCLRRISLHKKSDITDLANALSTVPKGSIKNIDNVKNISKSWYHFWRRLLFRRENWRLYPTRLKGKENSIQQEQAKSKEYITKTYREGLNFNLVTT